MKPLLATQATTLALATLLPWSAPAQAPLAETLPPLEGGKAPQTFAQMWAGFDPRKEPLDLEILKEWEEDGVVMRVVRFRIGVFKGKKAMMAAIYGFPKLSVPRVPGLVQIHGGGQYADHKAVLTNAKRGYATISIAWAGRLSSPEHRVTPKEVKLFWEGKREDPAYRITTDWGALDAYHAPSRPTANKPSPSSRMAPSRGRSTTSSRRATARGSCARSARAGR